MPTTLPTRIPNLHTGAGLRWLAPTTVAVAIVVATFLLMLIYPHLGHGW
jgi:hypothetical protein